MPIAHTPGPWAFYLPQHTNAFVTDGACNPIANLVVTSPADDSNAASNARLIAAAPDLLEALYVAKRALAEAMQPHLVPGLRNEYDIVAAAINKATGA